MRPKPALRTELLFYLSFLAAAALLVGVATTVVAGTIAPGEEFWMVMALVALEVGVFVVFGRHLVTRLVLRPLGQLTATADAVAAGDLDARAPDAETRDFATLAARLNRMTDHPLDGRAQRLAPPSWWARGAGPTSPVEQPRDVPPTLRRRFFPASWRGGRCPPSLPRVPSARSCSSRTGDRGWRVRTVRRCSSRSTRRNRRGAAPGSGSPLWRAPSTRWEGSCGSTRRARGARRSSCF